MDTDIRTKGAAGGTCTTEYQMIGDNWDKNILPPYRTPNKKKPEYIHLFNIYAIVDRVRPQVSDHFYQNTLINGALDISLFIPSVTVQQQLMKEHFYLLH